MSVHAQTSPNVSNFCLSLHITLDSFSSGSFILLKRSLPGSLLMSIFPSIFFSNSIATRKLLAAVSKKQKTTSLLNIHITAFGITNTEIAETDLLDRIQSLLVFWRKTLRNSLTASSSWEKGFCWNCPWLPILPQRVNSTYKSFPFWWINCTARQSM